MVGPVQVAGLGAQVERNTEKLPQSAYFTALKELDKGHWPMVAGRLVIGKVADNDSTVAALRRTYQPAG